MEYTPYVLLIHDKTKPEGRQISLLIRRNARVYRAKNGAILPKTDDEIARKLQIAYGTVERVEQNMILLTNGNRISWHREKRYERTILEKEEYAYLYKVSDGILVARPGIVKPVGEKAVFHILKENGGLESRCQVSKAEREVFNGALWLLAPEEEMAAHAFIQWANMKMDEYKEKLNRLGEFKSNMETYIEK